MVKLVELVELVELGGSSIIPYHSSLPISNDLSAKAMVIRKTMDATDFEIWNLDFEVFLNFEVWSLKFHWNLASEACNSQNNRIFAPAFQANEALDP